jgi:hypothetical protein
MADYSPETFAARWAEDCSPPSGTKSERAGKARNGRFTGVTHLSLLSAKTAGLSGHNWITQAESSTSTWYAFAEQVKTTKDSIYESDGHWGAGQRRLANSLTMATVIVFTICGESDVTGILRSSRLPPARISSTIWRRYFQRTVHDSSA